MLNFEDIIGHENIKLQIINSINAGTFSHAHIFSGEDGIGKSLVAKAAALKLLKKEKCRQYADIIEYHMQKNKKSIGIGDIRELLDEINKRPVEGDEKVIIIYEAQNMTVEAQNSFLKTIEEPPEGIYMMLLCDNLESMLDTVKSRCQVYKFYRLNSEDMDRFLQKNFLNINKEKLKAVTAFSDGIPGRAESFIKDESLAEIRDMVEEILLNIDKKSKCEILKYESFLLKYKAQWQEVFTWFLSYIRDVLIYKETGKIKLIMNIDKFEGIKDISESLSFSKLNGFIDIIRNSKRKLENNVNPGLVFDFMLLNMQEV